jgi:hypothetical protein
MPKRGQDKWRACKEEEEDQSLINDMFEQSVNRGDNSIYNNMGSMTENVRQGAGFKDLVQKVIQALAASSYLAQGTGRIMPTTVAISSPITSVGSKSPALVPSGK